MVNVPQPILQRFDVVRSVAARSGGFITTSELRGLGVPTATTTRWCRAGLLTRWHRGVYKTGSDSFGFESAVHLAHKLMTDDQAVGGRSALVLWDLPGASRGRVQVVGPVGRTSTSPHIKTTQYRDLRAADITRLNGLPVTTALRSVIDAPRFCKTGTIGAQLTDGVARGLFSYDEAAHRVAELSCPGKAGLAKLRAVLTTRIESEDVSLNSYERAAAQLFHNAGLPKPEAQYQVHCDGRTYYVDFAWPEQRLFVECDSMLAHSTPEQLQSDLRRQNDLLGLGWGLLRFTYWDIIDRPDGVVAALERRLYG